MISLDETIGGSILKDEAFIEHAEDSSYCVHLKSKNTEHEILVFNLDVKYSTIVKQSDYLLSFFEDKGIIYYNLK